MTNLLPTADFDGAWKYALEHYFPDFLALFFPDAYQAIDWNVPISFRSTELQQIAPDQQSGKQRADTLVMVQRTDGQPAQIFVHVEVQSQHDGNFAARMFRYHARLFDRDQVPVVSLAILGDEDRDWLPTQFGYAIWGCSLALHFPMVKLCTLDAASLATLRNPFATLTLIHRDAQETRGRPEERMRRKLARFRALFRLGYRPEELRTLIRLLDHLLRLTPGLQEMARATMRQIEREETGMETLITSFEELAREEGVQEGLAKGRQEGRQEGVQEGLAKGQRDLVLRQLTHKLGALDEALRVRVANLEPETLLRLSDALLDFVTRADLDAWLAALPE